MAKKKVRPPMAKKRKSLDPIISAEDRISDLPDEILSSILLRLPYEKAALTCTLSRRWQNIWKNTWSFCMNIVFNYNTSHLEPLVSKYFDTRSEDLLQLENEGWYNVEYVDKLIEKHIGSKIDQFRVSFNLDITFRVHINRWIKFAMEKKAKILQLNFQFGYYGKRRYNFPKTLLGCKKFGFESLRVLELKYVIVREKILEDLVSRYCPLLERLTVHGSEGLENLRVVKPISPTLKHLDLGFCEELQSVEIRDSNVVSFYLSKRFGQVDILFKNVPKLVEVSIPFFSYISKFSDYFSQLQILKTTIFPKKSDDYWRYKLIPEVIPYEFTNLKHLELTLGSGLEVCLRQLNSLMMVCPYLQTIVLKMPQPLNEPYYNVRFYSTHECPHEYLKVVKVLNYSGSETDDEFVNYFIRNATALKKIVINTRKYNKTYRSDGKTEAEDNTRTHVEHLKTKIPSTIKFICL